MTLINLTFTYGRELVQARGIRHLSYAQFAGKVGLLLDYEEWFDLDRVSDRTATPQGRWSGVDAVVVALVDARIGSVDRDGPAW